MKTNNNTNEEFILDERTMHIMFPFLENAFVWSTHYLKKKIWDGSNMVRLKYQITEHDETITSDYSEGFLEVEYHKILQNNINSNS
tara:strand:+ start:2783 stop:3040 length:258 start_codon:yes stop_codon:yes gene_type:complete